MRKISICFGLVVLLMLSSCSLGSKDIFSQIRVGMTYNEFRELNESEKSFYYMNYAFIEEKSDQSIVVEFSSDMQGVVKKEQYDFSSNYFVQDFDRIVPGMSVYEVVELIGMPIGSSTSGMRSLDFSSNDSSIYRVLWDDEMKVVECYKVKS